MHRLVRLLIVLAIVIVALVLRAFRTHRIVKAGTSGRATVIYAEKGMTVRDLFTVRLKLILEITRPDGSVFAATAARWCGPDTELSEGWTVDVAYVERTRWLHRSPVAILGDARLPRTRKP